MIFIAIFILVLIELLIVAWIDFKTEKISNKWILVNAGASVVFHIFARTHYPLSMDILLFPFGFICVGFVLYLMNIMGAGDSKFLASLFLLIPLEFHQLFFEKLILSTIVTGAILFLYRVIVNRSKLKAFVVGQYWAGIKQILQSRFSYAPVIFLAWVIMGVNIWK